MDYKSRQIRKNAGQETGVQEEMSETNKAANRLTSVGTLSSCSLMFVCFYCTISRRKWL